MQYLYFHQIHPEAAMAIGLSSKKRSRSTKVDLTDSKKREGAVEATERKSLTGDITHLLVAWSEGDLKALNAVFPLAFEDLRRIARKSFGRLPVDNLQPTELIGEIYEVLLNQKSVSWESRGQFYSFSAFLMERILLGYKRVLSTAKRGGQSTSVPLSEVFELGSGSDVSTLSQGQPSQLAQSSGRENSLKTLGAAVDIAEKLAELAKLDPKQADIVRYRFLLGLTQEETAKVLGVSVKTVGRKWRNAKRFLARELDEYSDD